MNRRTFLKQSTAVGAGLTILKSGILKAGNSPNEKSSRQAIRRTKSSTSQSSVSAAEEAQI